MIHLTIVLASHYMHFLRTFVSARTDDFVTSMCL